MHTQFIEAPLTGGDYTPASMVGCAAAIGNAHFHATRTRFRRLPIHIEDVLTSLDDSGSTAG